MKLEQCFNVWDFREMAEARLPRPFWDFLEGWADDGISFHRNMDAFKDYDLLPRVLMDVSKIDASTTVLGTKLKWPVYFSPTGASRMWHHQAELGVARAAARSNTLYGLSTVSTVTLEDVAKETTGPKMFQIYVMKDEAFNRHMIERCKAAGYTSLCLTVDTAVVGNRERDHRNGFGSPPKLTAKTIAAILARPRWCAGFLRNPDLSFANVKDWLQTEQGERSTMKTSQRYIGAQMVPDVTWERAAKMIEMWGGEFALKGVGCVEDAKRAVDIGATGVILSNHGGRQLDGSAAPIDLVGEVADAVGDKLDVLMDGGVRRGTDVVKALALGAKAVGIGRPYLYAFAAGGEKGVDRMMRLLYLEVRRAMALTGAARVEDLSRKHIRPRR